MGGGKCKKKKCADCREYNGVAKDGRKCNTCKHLYEDHGDPDPSPKKSSSSNAKKRPRSPSVSADDDSEGDAVSRSSPPPQSGDESDDSNGKKDVVGTILSRHSIDMKPVSFAQLKGSGKKLLASKAEVNAGLTGGRSKSNGLDATLRTAIRESFDEKAKKGKGKARRQFHKSNDTNEVDGRLQQVGRVIMMQLSYKCPLELTSRAREQETEVWKVPKTLELKKYRWSGLAVDFPPPVGSMWGPKRMNEWMNKVFPQAMKYQEERARRDPSTKAARRLWVPLFRDGTGRGAKLIYKPYSNLVGGDFPELIMGKGKGITFVVFDSLSSLSAPVYSIPDELYQEWWEEGKEAEKEKAAANGDAFEETDDDDDIIEVAAPPVKIKAGPKVPVKVKLEPKEPATVSDKRVTRSSKKRKTVSPAPDVTDLTGPDTSAMDAAQERFDFDNAEMILDMALEEDEKGYVGHFASAGPSTVSNVGASTSASAAPAAASDSDDTFASWSLGIPPPPPPAKKFAFE
ncbi:hypothetical protein EXIGLDRAFT_707284 [Exidia glandulosa HHB12029]|uniref:Uncharacterized protein n=1 Tax=Exidia glandulosa HHB12029 TaxID=1314781 RepID=A0A165JW54_EXIGL|nr:hypothetical protein EXIGLDRAFT_707284 [Exidia glandulosa HHB12029]